MYTMKKEFGDLGGILTGDLRIQHFVVLGPSPQIAAGSVKDFTLEAIKVQWGISG
jgi:hypothetical protein